MHDDGGYFETKGWSVEGTSLRGSDTSPVVDAAVTIAGGETVESQGAEPVVYEAEKHLMVFKLKPEDGGWAVSFIGFIS